MLLGLRYQVSVSAFNFILFTLIGSNSCNLRISPVLEEMGRKGVKLFRSQTRHRVSYGRFY